MRYLLILVFVISYFFSFGQLQAYNSWFTGNEEDLITQPLGGICLMGGASESDEAMIWFLQRAAGGDVLVLRTSGSDGYNDYFYSGLGVTINSVETIRFNTAAAAQEAYVIDKINKAEAIWFAGGDQWDYVSFWLGNAVGEAINNAITIRNAVIGGTSAGMAIQGGAYFSAENGTVTSTAALANPFANNVTVDNTPFLSNSILEHTITDTHFDNPDRRGRLMVFMARMQGDYGMDAKAIACDEYTAVCIDENNIARVFGEANEDDFAYFVRLNCEIENNSPEALAENTPLSWNHEGKALLAYRIKGEESGMHSFDLNTWQNGSGGIWHYWFADNGIFNQTVVSEVPSCLMNIDFIQKQNELLIYPNPATDVLLVKGVEVSTMRLIQSNGVIVKTTISNLMDVKELPEGLYVLEVESAAGVSRHKVKIGR